ncbi:uncharacterized protein LOC100164228 [Acyrthosiphon pisum]|uniref:MADF domain-containing protein n=1 Tax=Acyrthosiphon pisum TaxID=7029 RepID=A0A8R2B846_ACYPI|nr:uncharacterized protein LOC100164228 [Acyrthosiphon pisum]|eukprot:XP_008186349.1 PREDICTED: uncharacterized protein LOC100164228 [Acyrthosiphon pisum]
MSSVINVRLNEKMTLRFVELYRDQRVLWDKEHEAYNKRTERLRAYRRIAEAMSVEGLGVPEVASKIKNIRSTYLQELKKIKDSAQRHLVQSEEEDASSPYVPKLLWFSILDSMIGGAAVKRLYSSPSTADMLSIDYADESSCPASSNNYTTPFDYGSSYANDLADPAKRPSSSSSVVDEPPLAKRLMYERQQSSAELFSRYIATSLEALPPRLSVQAQKEVHDVLVKYKILELDQLEQQR